jgi:hypothetical protein
MSRSRLRRATKRKLDTSRTRSRGFCDGQRSRKQERAVQPEFSLLASYSEALVAHAAQLEQIQGGKDVSAVDGYVNCAAIVSAILKTSWQDEARALDLAARAVLLSRGFLKEFLDASGGSTENHEHLRLARTRQGRESFCPPGV